MRTHAWVGKEVREATRNGEGERGSAHEHTQAQETHDAEQHHHRSHLPPLLLSFFSSSTSITPHIIFNGTTAHWKKELC